MMSRLRPGASLEFLCMLTTVEQLRHRVETDCKGLVADLQSLTGRYGAEEAHAWENSLGKLSQVFHAPSLQPLHLYFGGRGSLALEYQLPAASSWCDVVLLGAAKAKPSAVIVELKDWVTKADKPGRYEGLIERQGTQVLHPSDQVRGYTEYCRLFHSAVADHDADVHGCVLFTKDHWASAYRHAPNEKLARDYPLFTVSPTDVNEHLPAFFADRISEPNVDFAEAFATGRYRQKRGYVAQIGAQIQNPKSKVFELLDNQRQAFALCWGALDQTFSASGASTPQKKVIVITGPPGSGKSVIAAKLWAALVTKPDLPPGDVVFTTTSMSQNSNWSDLFSRTTGMSGAEGVVRKATSYSPISTKRLGDLRKAHGEAFCSDGDTWRENLSLLGALGENPRDGAQDDQNLVSIVDEAHGLINPEHREGRGQFGFATTLGPQAYHIIRSSLVTVLLLDPAQGFRQRENTTVEDIRKWSVELGAGEPELISLHGAQFRCAGSVEYVTWIESVLAGRGPAANSVLAESWHTPAGNLLRGGKATMDFRVFGDPETWEDELRHRSEEGSSVRLLSTYSRAWKTEGAAAPHKLPPHLMDFHEPYNAAGQQKFWSRIWNFVPSNGGDYTWFVVGHPAGLIARDPLCEVGCPYAVRGFDYDYIGILWLNDLLWRDEKMCVNPKAVEERGMSALTTAARREVRARTSGAAVTALLRRVAQAYRILFTRALKGCYVWVPDTETRAHLQRSLGGS